MCYWNRYSLNISISKQLIFSYKGNEPNTEYLKGSDIKMDKSFVLVDENFETSYKNVFAGGDIVRYPLSIFDNKMINVGHWQTAQSHGIHVLLNNYSINLFVLIMIGSQADMLPSVC